MPLPELNESDRARLSALQADLVKRVYDQWRYFEQPLGYNIASGSYNKRAKKAGMDMQTLVDTTEQMGYIQRIPTSRGGYILLPYGIWKKLPPYKRDTWRNPTKAKEERAAEIDYGRKVRLLEEERDMPLYDDLGDPIIVDGAPEPPKAQLLDQPDLKDAIKDILNSESSGLVSTKKGEDSDAT